MEISDRSELNFDIPHSARIWDYWLGGKENFPSDRRVGDEIVRMNPQILKIARARRDFLRRAVTALVVEQGIRQFLDVGTGLPTVDNTHEVAQRAAPDARIVYVDNDPMVLAHARALLTSTPEGACAYIDADVRDTGTILAGAAGTLDLTRPVAVMLLGILAHITDDAAAHGIVSRLTQPFPAGSYLVVCDNTAIVHAEEMR